MRIESMLQRRNKNVEANIDYGFLTDSELEEFDKLLTKAGYSVDYSGKEIKGDLTTLPKVEQQRIQSLIEKATGDVVLTWLRQTTTKEKSFDDLYQEYKHFVEKNNYNNVYPFHFKERLEKAGVRL